MGANTCPKNYRWRVHVKKILLAVAIVFTPVGAFAQTPDPAFLQRAVTALEGQRNNALNAQVIAESNLAAAKEDLAKAQAKIKELEDAKAKPDKK